MQRVLPEAGGVGGVDEPASVVADVHIAKGKEGVACGKLVAVENNLLRRVLGRTGRAVCAAVDSVLLSFFGTGVVPPVTVAKGDAHVGLLHMREHLLVEVFAQAI